MPIEHLLNANILVGAGITERTKPLQSPVPWHFKVSALRPPFRGVCSLAQLIFVAWIASPHTFRRFSHTEQPSVLSLCLVERSPWPGVLLTFPDFLSSMASPPWILSSSCSSVTLVRMNGTYTVNVMLFYVTVIITGWTISMCVCLLLRLRCLSRGMSYRCLNSQHLALSLARSGCLKTISHFGVVRCWGSCRYSPTLPSSTSPFSKLLNKRTHTNK